VKSVLNILKKDLSQGLLLYYYVMLLGMTIFRLTELNTHVVLLNDGTV